jgi:hypothetical protein
MLSKVTAATTLLLAATAAVGLVTEDGAQAAESSIATGMRVISSDQNASFLPLAIGKSVVIELPRDIKDVLVASASIVQAYVRTSRHVYIVGMALGQTNVFFYDADGRQISALDINVTTGSPPAAWQTAGQPAKVVTVYRGHTGEYTFHSCTLALCMAAEKGEPPNTTHSEQIVHNLDH